MLFFWAWPFVSPIARTRAKVCVLKRSMYVLVCLPVHYVMGSTLRRRAGQALGRSQPGRWMSQPPPVDFPRNSFASRVDQQHQQLVLAKDSALAAARASW